MAELPAQKKEELIKVEQTPPQFGEAPGIAFTKVFWTHEGQCGEVNLTCRANSPLEALELLWNTVVEAKKRHGFSLLDPSIQMEPPKITSNEPVSPRVANVTIEKEPAPIPAGSNPAAIAPAQPNGLIRAVKMDVKPDADGKVSLQWYSQGHKYADIYSKFSLESALSLLRSTGQDWSEEMLSKTGTFTVSHDIYFRLSEKKNSRGNPYKDIVSVVARA